MLIELVTSPSGDWKILKRNGRVFASGHSISTHEWLELFNFIPEVTTKETEISDEEMEKLC